MKFKFGIEHEVAFVRSNGQFCDFSNTTFAQFDALIQALPDYELDRATLHVGDAGIRKKRWYIEGFERFTESGDYSHCIPKGIEIRTPVQTSIARAVEVLHTSFEQLRQVATAQDFWPALVSFNPQQIAFQPNPVLNAYERQNQDAEAQTESIAMMTYGPDLNLSCPSLSPADLLDVAEKLTYYSPSIVPFSFSAPFWAGQLWRGPSIRTYRRTGLRSAAIAYVESETECRSQQPPLTKVARLSSEVGRIEFKACDSCGDFELYGALLALLKGLILDTTLRGRSSKPSLSQHRAVAELGMQDSATHDRMSQVVAAAEQALKGDPDLERLALLRAMLRIRQTQADAMRSQFMSGQSIAQILTSGYQPRAIESDSWLYSRRKING